MAKLKIGQKANRVLKFLMGLRHPAVAQSLSAFGFDQETLNEGWEQLSAVTRIRLVDTNMKRDPKAVEVLDTFENLWFAVCRASLQRRYPMAYEALFHELYQTNGAEVAVTVSTFLERLEQMARGEGRFGEDGPAARAVLVERGLTDDVVQEAKNAAAKLRDFAGVEVEMPTAEAIAEAETQMWNWYLEWSAIARVAVKDRRLLRAMGFLNSSKKVDEAEQPIDSDVETQDDAESRIDLAPTQPDFRHSAGNGEAKGGTTAVN